MTCIVGLVQDGNVWIGSDDFFGGSNSKQPLNHSKAFRVGDMLIAFSGSARHAQVIKYYAAFPDRQKKDVACYMATDFVNEIRRVANDDKVEGVDSKEFRGTLLVAYEGRLFEINSDYFVLEIPDYRCGGSGCVAAQGAMSATPELDPEERINRALRASVENVPTVSGPFYIETLYPVEASE